MARSARRHSSLSDLLAEFVRMPPLQYFDLHVFVQLNDVYFLDARANYENPEGLLLPRIATMVKRLKAELPGRVTFCVPGDFLAPSCLGRLSRGRHMVETFNCLGVDYVKFGNHEFEQKPLTPATLADNIMRSNFTWLCANFAAEAPELKALVAAGDKVKTHEVIRLADGLAVVLFGMTLPGTYAGYGAASKPIDETRGVIDRIRRSDPGLGGSYEPMFVAMTHQDAADDKKMGAQYPELLLIMGGHDHDEDYALTQTRPIIVKAASNARTLRLNVLLHRRHRRWTPALKSLKETAFSATLNRMFDTKTQAAVDAAPASLRELIIPPEYEGPLDARESDGLIDDTRLRSGIWEIGSFDIGLFSFGVQAHLQALLDHILEDPETRSCIDRWEKVWDDQSGLTRAPIHVLSVPFDARDAHVRRGSGNVGNLAADALLTDAKGAPIAAIGLLNAGTLRIDRELPAGEAITARTICDLLFFDNRVELYKLVGRELWQILRKSFELKSEGGAEGHGDFLLISGIKSFCTTADVVRVVLVSDGSERELANDDTVHLIATTDYVATISKHYKAFFDGKKPERSVGAYNDLFLAAVRRLCDHPSDDRYDAIESDRWIGADAAGTNS
jgi:2',3'-cyclic-nucleotide 2'-phosphodiesterase (5'-nucleotidase family)